MGVGSPFAVAMKMGWFKQEGLDIEILYTEGGASTLRSALSAARATGAVLFEPFALTELAEAEARTGRVEEALGCLAAAEDVARQSGEVFWQLETGRVHDRLAALRT